LIRVFVADPKVTLELSEEDPVPFLLNVLVGVKRPGMLEPAVDDEPVAEDRKGETRHVHLANLFESRKR
jgi:hypothetical protein